jgi:hypothetical protein
VTRRDISRATSLSSGGKDDPTRVSDEQQRVENFEIRLKNKNPLSNIYCRACATGFDDLDGIRCKS